MRKASEVNKAKTEAALLMLPLATKMVSAEIAEAGSEPLVKSDPVDPEYHELPSLANSLVETRTLEGGIRGSQENKTGSCRRGSEHGEQGAVPPGTALSTCLEMLTS